MTSSTKHLVGQPHPFWWPKISSFLTFQALDLITQHLHENKQWTVTEKLDGVNMCVSSDGWIASRKKIVASVDDPTLSKQHCQGAPLSGVKPLHQQLLALKTHLANTFFQWQPDFQLLAYAELVVPGTASSKEDLYHYKKRHIHVGSLYVFALGLVLPHSEPEDIPFIFEHGFKVTENVKEPYFLVPMNANVSQLLKRFCIQHVGPQKMDSLHNILNHPKFNHNLMERKKEGYVLSSNDGNGYIKWKFYHSCSSQLDKQVEELIERQPNHSAAKTIAFKIANLYGSSSRFLSSVGDSAIQTKFNVCLRTNKESILERMTELTFAENFYKNMLFYTIVNELYFSLKQNLGPLCLEPKLKIQLKKKIATDLAQLLQAHHMHLDLNDDNVSKHCGDNDVN